MKSNCFFLTAISICFMLSIMTAYAQSPANSMDPAATPANFARAMSFTNPTKEQMDTLLNLCTAYSFSNQDSCIFLGERAVELGKDFPNPKAYGRALLACGYAYSLAGRIEEAKAHYLKGKELAIQNADSSSLANAYNKLGVLAVEKGDYEEGIQSLMQAGAVWEGLKDTANIFRPYLNISWIQFRLDHTYKAIEFNEKAFEWAQRAGDERAMMYSLNNRAILHKEVAGRYRLKADTVAGGEDLYKDSIQINLDKAIAVLEEALSLTERVQDKGTMVNILGNMAEIKLLLGKHEEAIALSKRAAPIAQELGAIRILLQYKYNLANAYRSLKQYDKALYYGKESLKIADDHEMEHNQMMSNYSLYQTYKELSELDSALAKFEKYQRIKEKVDNTERNKTIADAEAKYQNAQNEKQILEQENDILALETANEHFQKQRNYFIAGGLILAILAFFGFQLNKTRKQRNDKIAFAEALIFAQEEERKRIARDLHDGIGQSLLLIKRQMDANEEATLENQELIAETLEEVRSISRDLHPFQLEKFGLTTAIQEAISKVERSTELFISQEIENIDQKVPVEAQIHIFRTIQEALSNIVKHAEATAAKVSIQLEGAEVVVQVMDNGKGFDHEIAVARSKSLGLKTMYERISAIGGKLELRSGSPKGSVIEFRVPQVG